MENALFEAIKNCPFEMLNGQTSTLKDFDHKQVLFMNVASRCGFRKQEEALLREIQTYPDILFVLQPSTQFLRQEPMRHQELCQIKRNQDNLIYLKKADVKGKEASLIYKELDIALSKDLTLPLVLWNFTKVYINLEKGRWKRFFSFHSIPYVLRSIKELD